MKTSCLLDLHERAGARMTELPHGPTVLTYGDVPGEYRAALEGCVLFDDTARGCVRVRGADAVELLHRILANEVRKLEPGTGNRSLLLSPKGKVLHAFDLAREADGMLLSTQPGGQAGLIQAIDTYLFTEDVSLEDVTEEHAPLSLCGPASADVVERVLGAGCGAGSLAPHAFRDVEHGGVTVRLTALPVAGSPGLRLAAPPAAAPELWRALVQAGATPAGQVARDSLRCEAGQGEPGVDVTDAVYPQEARLEPAFSLEKGCYIGQEVVAKIDTYGGMNKCLMALAVEHDDPVPAGTRLLREEDGELRDLGVVTSWAYSFALDGGMVLAYVKRRHQAPGTRFRLGEEGGEATVVELPLRAGTVEVTGGVEAS